MKRILVLLLALGTFGAHALPQVKNIRLTKAQLLAMRSGKPAQVVASPKASAPVELQPVRQGKMKAEIFRTEIHTQPDGSYLFSNESTCIGEAPADVYDVRNLPSYFWTIKPGLACFSEIDHRQVAIEVTGALFLQEGKVFSDEPVAPLKTAYAQLSTNEGGHVTQFFLGKASQRGLDVPSMLVPLENNGFVSCLPSSGSGEVECNIIDGVYFSAVTEFSDVP